MIKLQKKQVKIISVLIALVFMGSVVALALSQSGSGIASGGDARTAEQIAHLLKPQLQFQVIGAVCNPVKDVVEVWQHCQRQQKENQQNRVLDFLTPA